MINVSYSGANNQKFVDFIKREVLVRHSSAKEEDIVGKNFHAVIQFLYVCVCVFLAACYRYYQSLYQDHVREGNGNIGGTSEDLGEKNRQVNFH